MLVEQLYRVNAGTGRGVPRGGAPFTHRSQDMFPCMRRAPLPDDPPALPGRRVLLGGALALAATALGGCGVRWEDDAPEIPFIPIPTREPIPAEEALLWLLRDSHDLATTAESDHALYAEQAAVLRTALYRAGVPIGTVDGSLDTPVARPPAPTVTAAPFTAIPLPEPEPTDSPTGVPGETPTVPVSPEPVEPTTPPPPPLPRTAPREGPAAALRRLRDLSGCGAGLFPLVVAILAQRWAAVHRGRYDIPSEAVPARPAAPWPSPDLARPFAALTDPARYGFEVVAAQSREEARVTALTALDDVRRLYRQQDARSDESADGPAIGYPLPFPVSSQESAAQLAGDLLTALVDGYAALVPGLAGTDQRAVAPDLVTWLGTVTALGTDWDLPLSAFPGMTTPAVSPTPEPTGSP